MVLSRRRELALDTKCAAPKRLRAWEDDCRATRYRRHFDGGPASVQGLEVGQLRQMDGESNRLPGDEGRVLHEELGLLRPTRHVQRVSLGAGALTCAGGSAAARRCQEDHTMTATGRVRFIIGSPIRSPARARFPRSATPRPGRPAAVSLSHCSDRHRPVRGCCARRRRS